MSDQLELFLILVFWAVFVIFALGMLVDPKTIPKRNEIKLNLKSKRIKLYIVISAIIEVLGIVLLIISFFLPWYSSYFRGWGPSIVYAYFKDAYEWNSIFIDFLYFFYFASLGLILIKILKEDKINFLFFGELLELFLIIPGIMFIFTLEFPSGVITIPERSYLGSFYASGFILYTFSIMILISNGLQLSINLRLKTFNSNEIKRNSK